MPCKLKLEDRSRLLLFEFADLNSLIAVTVNYVHQNWRLLKKLKIKTFGRTKIFTKNLFWVSFVTTDELVRVTKITSRIGIS